MLLLSDIRSTLIAFTTMLGILTTFASSLMLLMINIALDVSTRGMLKPNFIMLQYVLALEQSSTMASDRLNNFSARSSSDLTMLCRTLFNLKY